MCIKSPLSQNFVHKDKLTSSFQWNSSGLQRTLILTTLNTIRIFWNVDCQFDFILGVLI